MGKLILNADDLKVVHAVYGTKRPQIRVADNEIEIEAGAVKLLLSELETNCALEHNGVRFQVSAKYQDGSLQAEFE